jgi:hypothetical protein
MVVGWEALIVQKDVRGLTASEGEELSVWAARALMSATLREGADVRHDLKNRQGQSGRK